jgi:hypothetical protein
MNKSELISDRAYLMLARSGLSYAQPEDEIETKTLLKTRAIIKDAMTILDTLIDSKEEIERLNYWMDDSGRTEFSASEMRQFMLLPQPAAEWLIHKLLELGRIEPVDRAPQPKLGRRLSPRYRLLSNSNNDY